MLLFIGFIRPCLVFQWQVIDIGCGEFGQFITIECTISVLVGLEVQIGKSGFFAVGEQIGISVLSDRQLVWVGCVCSQCFVETYPCA